MALIQGQIYKYHSKRDVNKKATVHLSQGFGQQGGFPVIFNGGCWNENDGCDVVQQKWWVTGIYLSQKWGMKNSSLENVTPKKMWEKNWQGLNIYNLYDWWSVWWGSIRGCCAERWWWYWTLWNPCISMCNAVYSFEDILMLVGNTHPLITHDRKRSNSDHIIGFSWYKNISCS